MKSIFLVWKDKNCNGENPEWIYMKANEFFEFKKQPENADRRFVQVGDKKSSLDDTVIFIEANEELYKKSNAEQSRKSRISKTKKEHPLTFISLDALRGSDEDIDNHERYSYSEGDEEYIMGKLQVGELHEAIKDLTDSERKTLDIILFSYLHHKSERETAMYFGIPQKTLNNRKIKIFKKIEKKLAQNKENRTVIK